MLHMLRQSQQFKQTRIIALTASVMNEEVEQLQSAGFEGCLAKPIDVENFPETLDRIMQGEYLWHIFG